MDFALTLLYCCVSCVLSLCVTYKSLQLKKINKATVTTKDTSHAFLKFRYKKIVTDLFYYFYAGFFFSATCVMTSSSETVSSVADSSAKTCFGVSASSARCVFVCGLQRCVLESSDDGGCVE